MSADHYHRDVRDSLEAIIARCEASPDLRGELYQQAMDLSGGQFTERVIGRILCEAKRRLGLEE